MAISGWVKVSSYPLLFKEKERNTPLFADYHTDDSDIDTETETEVLLDEETGLCTPTSYQSQRKKERENNLSKQLLPRLNCGCGWVPELFCVLFLSLVFMGTLIFFALTVNVAQYIELCGSQGHGSLSHNNVSGSGEYRHKREKAGPTMATSMSVSTGADVPIITMKAYGHVTDWSPDGVPMVRRTPDYTSTLNGKSRSTVAPTPTSTGFSTEIKDGPVKSKSPELIDRFWSEMLGF